MQVNYNSKSVSRLQGYSKITGVQLQTVIILRSDNTFTNNTIVYDKLAAICTVVSTFAVS